MVTIAMWTKIYMIASEEEARAILSEPSDGLSVQQTHPKIQRKDGWWILPTFLV